MRVSDSSSQDIAEWLSSRVGEPITARSTWSERRPDPHVLRGKRVRGPVADGAGEVQWLRGDVPVERHPRRQGVGGRVRGPRRADQLPGVPGEAGGRDAGGPDRRPRRDGARRRTEPVGHRAGHCPGPGGEIAPRRQRDDRARHHAVGRALRDGVRGADRAGAGGSGRRARDPALRRPGPHPPAVPDGSPRHPPRQRHVRRGPPGLHRLGDLLGGDDGHLDRDAGGREVHLRLPVARGACRPGRSECRCLGVGSAAVPDGLRREPGPAGRPDRAGSSCRRRRQRCPDGCAT